MFQEQRMTPNIRVEREHQSSSQCSNSNDLAAVSLFASESLLLLEGSNLLFFWWSGVCWCTSLCQLHERFVWQNPLKVIGYHLLFLCRGCWCAWLAYCYYFSRWRMIVDKSLIIISTLAKYRPPRHDNTLSWRHDKIIFFTRRVAYSHSKHANIRDFWMPTMMESSRRRLLRH